MKFSLAMLAASMGLFGLAQEWGQIEAWEGFYNVELDCPASYATDVSCQALHKAVDGLTVVLTRRGPYAMFLKKGESWPFYGFVLDNCDGRQTCRGTTRDESLRVEVVLERIEGQSDISGWIRDTRLPADVRVKANARPLNAKRTLEKLYRRKLSGEPLAVSEVAGIYSGDAHAEGARLIVKDSALSVEPQLTQASYQLIKDNSIEVFSELELDPIRGLLIMIQYRDGLPMRKWVLAFRRDDIDESPWLLGTGMNLRTFVSYDINLEKRARN